jgi:hypothetical protein
MPLPIIGAAGLVGKLFGAGIKALKSVRLKRTAKKKAQRAEKLAAEAVNKIQGLTGSLFTVNEPNTTAAQNTVFPETESPVSFASNQIQGPEKGFKIPVWGWIVAGIVGLLIILKLK